MSQPSETPRDGRLGAVRRLRGLMTEQMEPARAAAAVFLGITIGIVPLYGLQTILAYALATRLRLNRPLTVAWTFISNPPLLPFLLIGSLQLGHLATHGSLMSLSLTSLTSYPLGDHVLSLFVGSMMLSIAVGGVASALTYAFLAHRKASQSVARAREREWRAYVNARFGAAPSSIRRYVRWKTRLDRIFALLLDENLGPGAAVDLGCGYGTALALIAFREPHRTLYGCDVDASRIGAAGRALAGLDVHLSIADVRTFPLPAAGLILILDVLQYLATADQAALLRRCVSTLTPGGRLILRLPEPARGFYSSTTRLLERIIFCTGRWSTRPTYQPADVYRQLLAEAGLVVDVRRYRNRLPLAHVVIAAQKPGTRA
jgi:uncharacterized protein (DUF2062 family)/trans-aconitate methyltransferase